MAGPPNKKRSREEKAQGPSKKQRQKAAAAYHSDSEDQPEDEPDFEAVNLLDSDDDDIHNAKVDDVSASDNDASSSEDESAAVKPLKKLAQQKNKKKQSTQEEEEEEEDDDDEDSESDSENEIGSDGEPTWKISKSKRNDPNAFATSLSKILSTKLATSKRADPVLARSAAAHEASKAAVDSALEAKARKQIRDEKRRAMEKGRVKDVLIATANEQTGELETSTGEILETERRLRKVAQRGVVKLFNAVRASQVKAAESAKANRTGHVIGMGQREEKVNEMSKKGFLELIASGGGGLKKGALEEA